MQLTAMLLVLIVSGVNSQNGRAGGWPVIPVTNWAIPTQMSYFTCPNAQKPIPILITAQNSLQVSRIACAACPPGFTTAGHLCIGTVPGCTRYNQWGRCAECTPRCFLNEQTNACYIRPVQQIQIPYCITVNQTTRRCLQCCQGYGVTNQGFCSPRDKFCAQFSLNGQCAQCFYHYFRFQNGRCSYDDENCQSVDPMNGICLTCYNRFWLNPRSNRCTPVRTNCWTFNPSTGYCITCPSLYWTLNGGECIRVKA